MLPDICHSLVGGYLAAPKRLSFATQFPILVGPSTKFPDIVVQVNDHPFAVFEVKIGAAEQQHTFLRDAPLDQSLDAGPRQEEFIIQGQLTTYSDWIGKQNGGEWRGAVVLLTHRTPAPAGFENSGSSKKAVIHTIRTWRDVGNWLTTHLDLRQISETHCSLAHDFHQFLEENGFMSEFATSRDLAATELFMPSYLALHHTLASIAKAITVKYPKIKGGNNHNEFWAQGNVYWSWYYINKKLNLPGSKFYLAFGICFPGTDNFGSSDGDKLPRHEPFFFIILADEWGNKKASEVLTKIPENWVQISKEYEAVAGRPLSKFAADPDIRANEAILWAQAEVGQLVTAISGFEAAPIEETVDEEPS